MTGSYGPVMAQQTVSSLRGDQLGQVYGAALAACEDPSAAEEVTRQVLLSPVRDGRPTLEGRALVERALLLGAHAAPAAELAGIAPDDRAVIVLARLGRYSTVEIAIALEISVEEVKAAMTRGLRSAVRAGRPAVSAKGL